MFDMFVAKIAHGPLLWKGSVFMKNEKPNLSGKKLKHPKTTWFRYQRARNKAAFKHPHDTQTSCFGGSSCHGEVRFGTDSTFLPPKYQIREHCLSNPELMVLSPRMRVILTTQRGSNTQPFPGRSWPKKLWVHLLAWTLFETMPANLKKVHDVAWSGDISWKGQERLPSRQKHLICFWLDGDR